MSITCQNVIFITKQNLTNMILCKKQMQLNCIPTSIYNADTDKIPTLKYLYRYALKVILQC